MQVKREFIQHIR